MSLYSFMEKSQYAKSNGLSVLAQRVLAEQQSNLVDVKVGL